MILSAHEGIWQKVLRQNPVHCSSLEYILRNQFESIIWFLEADLSEKSLLHQIFLAHEGIWQNVLRQTAVHSSSLNCILPNHA